MSLRKFVSLAILCLLATLPVQGQRATYLSDAELARLANLYRAELAQRAAERRLNAYQPLTPNPYWETVDTYPRRRSYRYDDYSTSPYRYNQNYESRYLYRHAPRTCITTTYYQTCY